MKKYYCYKYILSLLVVVAGFTACDNLKDDQIPRPYQLLKLHNDYVTTSKNQAVLLDVLANDSVRIQADLQFGKPGHGSLQTGNNGSLYYQPDQNFTGADTLDYRVCMGSECATAFVFITVLPDSVNTCTLSAADDAATTKEDTPVSIPVLLNDTRCGGSLDTGRLPVNGSVSIDQLTNEIIYAPYPRFFGTDSFEYKITRNGVVVSAEVIVTVTQNSTPVCTELASADYFSVSMNGMAVVNILKNDTVCNAVPVVTVKPPNGKAFFNSSTNRLVYKPNPGFIGQDILTYTLTGPGGSSSATVTFTVVQTITQNCLFNANNDYPVFYRNLQAQPDSFIIDVIANDIICVNQAIIITPILNQYNYGSIQVIGSPSHPKLLYLTSHPYTNIKDLIRYELRQGNNTDIATVVIDCQ